MYRCLLEAHHLLNREKTLGKPNLEASMSRTMLNGSAVEKEDPEAMVVDLGNSSQMKRKSQKQLIPDDRITRREKTFQGVASLEMLALTCRYRREMHFQPCSEMLASLHHLFAKLHHLFEKLDHMSVKALAPLIVEHIPADLHKVHLVQN